MTDSWAVYVRSLAPGDLVVLSDTSLVSVGLQYSRYLSEVLGISCGEKLYCSTVLSVVKDSVMILFFYEGKNFILCRAHS